MPRLTSLITLLVRDRGPILVEAYDYSRGGVEPLGKHVHPTWQLGWSPNSGGEHWIRGSTRGIPRGAVSIIPPGEVHAPSQDAWVAEPASFMMAYVDDRVFRQLSSELGGRDAGTPSFRSGVIDDDPCASYLFARAHRSMFQDDPLAWESAWLAFNTRLLTRHAESRPPAIGRRREPRAVTTALAMLHERVNDRLTLTELARATDITPARLCRAFTHHVGVPPHAYQLRLRVETAKQLLLRGRTVVDVAAATGFADQSHLGRHFKRIVGVAPSVYKSALNAQAGVDGR